MRQSEPVDGSYLYTNVTLPATFEKHEVIGATPTRSCPPKVRSLPINLRKRSLNELPLRRSPWGRKVTTRIVFRVDLGIPKSPSRGVILSKEELTKARQKYFGFYARLARSKTER